MAQKVKKSKQGRPPRESEKGPYAVVDEFVLESGPFQNNNEFTSVALFAHFLDPSISEIRDLLQWQFLLIS